jgi:cell volume regulation protein A
VRDLGLPRDAVVNVIVRGSEAVPPRGSTRLRDGDIVHVLVRQRVAAEVRGLTDRWRTGPIGPPPRPVPPKVGRKPVFSAWRWSPRDGNPSQVMSVRGQRVVAQLRIRRDEAGGLWVLEDGRYAVTGPVAAAGSAGDLSDWAAKRLRSAVPDERAWLQTVIGALAADRHEIRRGDWA